MAEPKESERHGKTLFIRNLPYSTTNEKLENIFSDIGPIKTCFVVKDKDSGKCRGFGYVKFTLLEDAEKAFKTIKKVDNRNIHIIFANKKEKKKRFGQSKKDEQNVEQSSGKKESLPTENKTFATPNKWSKKKTIIEPKKGQQQLHNPLNEGKRARLIIRNLSFKCSNEELKKTCELYGTVVDVHIPTKKSGQKLGFGFVQFANKAQAGQAVKELNGKNLCGRTVAVDWTLPKDKFEAHRAVTTNEQTGEKNVEKSDDQKNKMELDDIDIEEERPGKNKTFVTQIKKINKKESKVELNNDTSGSQESSNGVETEEDESEEEDDNEESEEENDENEEDDESDEEDDDDNEEDNEESEEEDDSGIEVLTKKSTKFAERRSDVTEGRTVFVRNLPFNAEEEALEEYFSQFGEVKYARIVVDYSTGMSRGSAFIQFRTKESADNCIKAASENEEGICVSGRRLLVTLAVSREQAVGLIKKKEEKKEKKDSRNLYLAREGLIREGTELAKVVPAADMVKRTQIAAANRAKLKNQNIFVSSTRLCVHNIPATVTDSALRLILYKAAGQKSAKITECRIMRDLNRLNSQGVGKSRGFAFCAFTQHEHALNALRHLNNNPDIFGDKKRPIVEFSLENRKALEIKQKRIERSQTKCKQIEEAAKSKLQPAAPGGKQKKKRKYKKKLVKDIRPLDTMKSQDKVARSLHQGPLGLPSHLGPKVRHRKRAADHELHNKGKKKFKKEPKKSPSQNKNKSFKSKNFSKRKDFDDFDKMVASYKQKIITGFKS